MQRKDTKGELSITERDPEGQGVIAIAERGNDDESKTGYFTLKYLKRALEFYEQQYSEDVVTLRLQTMVPRDGMSESTLLFIEPGGGNSRGVAVAPRIK